jgi:U3 small nucleolar RNA-associated protein 14
VIQQDQMAALAAETSRLRLQLRRMQANNAAWAERVRLMESSWQTASVQLVSRRTRILRISRTLAFRAARRCYHVALRIPVLRGLAAKARAVLR